MTNIRTMNSSRNESCIPTYEIRQKSDKYRV